MIYSINLLLCAISAFCFKNIFTFLLFAVIVVTLYHFFIKKLSDITNLLYFLTVIVILTGGLVIWLLPNKENIIPSIIVDAYYLGPVEFLLFIALLISIVFDVIYLKQNKKVKNRIVKKPVKKIDNEKDKAFKENVSKIEKTIKKETEKIKKIVETKTPEKKTTKKKVTKKASTKKPVKKTIKKEEKK